MPALLEAFPVPWSAPAVRELRDALAETLYRERDIEVAVVEAGVSPAAITWEQPARLLWFAAMNEAAATRRLPALVDRAVALRPALRDRVAELLRAKPVVAAPLPGALSADDPRWRNFAGGGRERQLVQGQPTLLDVAFLAQGLAKAAAVCRLTALMGGAVYHGTGFRIGARTVLTNHHVLHDWDGGGAPAGSVEAAFGYEVDVRGALRTATLVPGDVTTIRGEREHDFAVIDLARPIPDGVPVLPLDPGATVDVDDRVYIVQHPKGLPKKIGMHHNLVRYADADVVQYWTDTEAGSSGAPVFNDDWAVVALHHQWVDAPDGDGLAYRNQGRAIGRVVERLAALGISPGLPVGGG